MCSCGVRIIGKIYFRVGKFTWTPPQVGTTTRKLVDYYEVDGLFPLLVHVTQTAFHVTQTAVRVLFKCFKLQNIIHVAPIFRPDALRTEKSGDWLPNSGSGSNLRSTWMQRRSVEVQLQATDKLAVSSEVFLLPLDGHKSACRGGGGYSYQYWIWVWWLKLNTDFDQLLTKKTKQLWHPYSAPLKNVLLKCEMSSRMIT